MYISLIGPSGSGKDTQAHYIAEEFDIVHFSIGQLFRDMKGRNDKVAQKVLDIINQGNLVPDEITVEVMSEYIQKNCQNGFVVTGFPRTINQFEMLTKELKNIGIEWSRIVHLELSDDEALNRMRLQAKAAKEAGTPREDASEEKMKNRIAFYHENIDPILEKSEEMGVLENIDASKTIPQIKNDIYNKLS